MLWTCSRIPKSHFDTSLLANVVGKERRQRVLAFRHDERKWQSLIADQLMRALALHCGFKEHRYLISGQPVLDGAYISASHDTDLVVAAISNQPIGVDTVDIQRCIDLNPYHILSSKELAIPDGQRILATPLYKARSWAAKEAALKQQGRGIDLNPRQLSLCHGATGWILEGIVPDNLPVHFADISHHHIVAIVGDSSPLVDSSYVKAKQLHQTMYL